jgi:hypothetical protein
MKIATALVLGLLAAGCVASGSTTPSPTTVWQLNHLQSVGGFVPEVLGAPKARNVGGHEGLCFDGLADGLVVPVNPLEGSRSFTVEVLLHPDGDGPSEQRFLHIQDDLDRRVLLETRVNPGRTWALDTFLRATDTDKLTLLDRAQTMPTDQWYWAALVFDGKTMSHYVNGTPQLDGKVAFTSMVKGRISLGVRQNRVYWFKGCISEVRFSSIALEPRKLRRPN